VRRLRGQPADPHIDDDLRETTGDDSGTPAQTPA
jgi:hypothetical protein